MSDKASNKPLQKPLMAKPTLTRSEAKAAPAKPKMLVSESKYNPLKRIKNAWTTTNGVSGKICMVLFYAVIVGKIAWAFKDLIYPKVGWECFHQGLSLYEDEVIAMLTRTLAVMTIGFYCLAGYNGIGMMNTFFVFAINAAFGWIMFTTHPIVLLSGDTISGAPSCHADIDRIIVITQVFLWTSLVAFNFAFFKVV